jgi:hypothetical protein
VWSEMTPFITPVMHSILFISSVISVLLSSPNQDEHVRLCRRQRRKQHARFLPAAEILHRRPIVGWRVHATPRWSNVGGYTMGRQSEVCVTPRWSNVGGYTMGRQSEVCATPRWSKLQSNTKREQRGKSNELRAKQRAERWITLTTRGESH